MVGLTAGIAFIKRIPRVRHVTTMDEASYTLRAYEAKNLPLLLVRTVVWNTRYFPQSRKNAGNLPASWRHLLLYPVKQIVVRSYIGRSLNRIELACVERSDKLFRGWYSSRVLPTSRIFETSTLDRKYQPHQGTSPTLVLLDE